MKGIGSVNIQALYGTDKIYVVTTSLRSMLYYVILRIGHVVHHLITLVQSIRVSVLLMMIG